MSNTSNRQEALIINDMKNAGFVCCNKIGDTLQGSIWIGLHELSNLKVVIKVTKKYLHSKSLALINGITTKFKVYENILMEKEILKYLTKNKNCPLSVTKYVGFFKSNVNYYLVMEYGGKSCFDFIIRAHQFILVGKIKIVEWHKLVKVLFKQMIECIEYIHSQNVCHFDISIENFLVNDINIVPVNNGQHIKFVYSDIQIKICDFGLSDFFKNCSNFFTNKYCGKRCYKSPEITHKKKLFDAKSNDVFSLGVCLWMMITGAKPWHDPIDSDQRFVSIINGHITELLASWNKLNYVNKDLLDLFGLIFQYEDKRISLKEIKQHKWLK